jgi:HK97 family phage portal protein
MLANLLRRGPEQAEKRASQVLAWGPWGESLGASTGVQVSTESALQLLTVYGCVTLISDTIATLPRDVFRTNSSGVNEEVNKPKWLEQPNPRTDIIEFLTQTLSSLLLDGNAYWAYATDLNLSPTEIHVLDPADVVVKVEKQRDLNSGALANAVVYYVKGQRFRGKLLHIKGIVRPGQLKGLSPIEAARQSIGLGLAAQQFAGTFYANGVTMSGYVTTPGELTKDQARDLRDNISRDHGGLHNAHLPGVLTNGATWTSSSVTPEQAQFLETRQFQAAEIAAQMFLLDPSMLGIASAGTRGQNLTYANLEQRGIHLVQFTLLRWIIRLERAFDFLLPNPQYMKFNVSALERADLMTRYQAYRIANPTAAWLTDDEIRDFEDLGPMPASAIPPVQPVTVPLVAPAPNGKKPVGANT